MTWLSRFQRPRPSDTPDNGQDEEGEFTIDRHTGEISRRERTGSDTANASAGDATIEGERSIPSVNRERSMQSRISGALALGVMLLLGAGFLFWYYSTQFAATRDAAAAAKKLEAERIAGDSKVPPLGRIDPPLPPPSPVNAAPTPEPSSPVSNATAPPPPAGPPTKTPAELMLERQLAQPVLRSTSGRPSAAAPSFAIAPSDSALASGTNVTSLASGGGSTSGGALATNLRPTQTPAVTAQLLPTRRFLLPKGAFVDCTLETAIDSTYEGMTTCIGASDIYGADGKVVLLERGTKYVGEQKGSPQQGQGRVFVLWSEARTPTGVVVQLASPGTDELGRNGLPGFVDNHFWERFGAAILISVLDGTMQALAASQQRSSSGNTGGGAVVIGPQGSNVVAEVLRGTVSIPPTVVKNQGERIQILVARDVDFRAVYALRNQPAPQ